MHLDGGLDALGVFVVPVHLWADDAGMILPVVAVAALQNTQLAGSEPLWEPMAAQRVIVVELPALMGTPRRRPRRRHTGSAEWRWWLTRRGCAVGSRTRADARRSAWRPTTLLHFPLQDVRRG